MAANGVRAGLDDIIYCDERAKKYGPRMRGCWIGFESSVLRDEMMD